MLSGIKRQLRSVISWDDPDPNSLFYQWSDNGDELKNATKLIVGPGQGCIFVYEGEVKAMIVKEGITTLNTANIPFWTTLKKFMQFFESEHKVGIFFFRLTKVLDQKWGTSSPIKYQDPVYNFPVSLMAYGNFSYRISNPRHFFVNIVGGQSHYSVDSFRLVMTSRLLQPLSDYLAKSQHSYADIDANRDEIAFEMLERLESVFTALGFMITDFRIEGTQFDDETLTRIHRIADVTAEAHAAKVAGLGYAQLQQLEAMREAARNESGAAGAGVGLGAGIGLGQVMSQDMLQKVTPTVASTPSDEPDIMARLQKLQQMHEAALITDSEYADKKRALLDQL